MSAVVLATGAAVRANATMFGRFLPAPRMHSHAQGRGPAILLLNGIGASAAVWPRWVTRCEPDHQVIRMDSRGTGHARSLTAAFTIADLADDALRCLRDHEVTRATIVGWSMGGMVAQELAIRHPQAVERLILVATIPPVPASALPVARMWAMATRLAVHTATSGWPPDFAPLAGPLATEAMVSEFAGQLGRGGLAWWAPVMQSAAIGTWRGPRRLAHIDAPTVILHGACDPVVPPRNASVLARLIPHARVEILSGVGHLVPYEAGHRLRVLLAH